MRWAAPLLVLAIAPLPAATAQAEPEPPPHDPQDPQLPFDEGRALMRSGRLAEAVEKFEQSLAIRTTGGALLNLADCYEKLGRWASSVATFDRARAFLADAGDERSAVARARADALRPHLSTITPSARGAPGASAWIDGTPAPIGVPRPVDGGEHVVSIRAPCRRPFETRATIWWRDAQKPIDGYLPASDEPSCPAALPPASRSSWSRRDTTAVVIGSAGVVALGVAGFFGLRALGTKHDLEALCADYPRGCPAARRSEVDGLASDADRQASIATIASVVGLAALAGAAIVVLTASGTMGGDAR